MRRIIVFSLLLFSVISMISTVSANDHVYIGDYSVEWGNEVNNDYDADRIKCDSDAGDCPNTGATDAYFKVCGDTWSLYRENIDDPTFEYEYRFGTTHQYPELDFGCTIGENSPIKFTDTEDNVVARDGSLTIEPRNMDAHKGDYLMIAADLSGSTLESDPIDKVHGIYLSNSLDHIPIEVEKPGRVVAWDSDLTGAGDDMGDWRFTPATCEIDADTYDNQVEQCTDKSNTDYQDSSSNAEDVRQDPFSTDSSRSWHLSYSESRSPSSATPVRGHAGYSVAGDIRTGFDPINPGPIDEPSFYICREGATITNSNGDKTGVVMNENAQDPTGPYDQNLYKCEWDSTSTDPDNFRWESVTQCEDDIDNDGDGSIDDNDPSCDISYREDAEDDDTTQDVCYPLEDPSSGEGCTPEFDCSDAPLVGKSSYDIYYAYYKNETDNCKFESFGDWEYTESTFAGDYPQYPNGYTCVYPDDQLDVKCPYDWNSTGDSEGLWEQKGEMPAVEYGSRRVYFDLLAEVQNRNITADGVETDFVHNYVGWDTKHQGLYEAEKRYDADMIESGIDESNCNFCHNGSWWYDRNLTNVDGYIEENASKFRDAWRIGNAGSNYSGVSTYAGSPFKGGFYGNCNTTNEGVWKDQTGDISFSDQNWRCEGAVEIICPLIDGCVDTSTPEEEDDLIPTVLLPETNQDGSQREIGLGILPYVHMSDTPDFVPSDLNTYSQAVAGTDNEGDSIDSMTVECWAGSANDRPSSCSGSDECIREEQTSVSSSNVYGFGGQVNTGNHTGYACSWIYHTLDGRTIAGEDVVELHKNQNPGDEYYDFRLDAEDEYGLVTDEEWNDPGSVIEGW